MGHYVHGPGGFQRTQAGRGRGDIRRGLERAFVLHSCFHYDTEMNKKIPSSGSSRELSKRFSGMPIDDPYPRWYHPERSGNGATFFEKFIGEKVLTD